MRPATLPEAGKFKSTLSEAEDKSNKIKLCVSGKVALPVMVIIVFESVPFTCKFDELVLVPIDKAFINAFPETFRLAEPGVPIEKPVEFKVASACPSDCLSKRITPLVDFTSPKR